jgi:hypothetical protein
MPLGYADSYLLTRCLPNMLNYTPYQYAGNKPINDIDIDGLEATSSKPSPSGGNQSIADNGPARQSAQKPLHGVQFYDIANYNGYLPETTYAKAGESLSVCPYTLLHLSIIRLAVLKH